ncbi:DgyrCDS198 [Dimorphilus gyrociliatus]|uniref:DgyrCDS198 n=1 Tax=Dimorphilus gyrociliatus TaxID=2664684 RepID=A0A7I8V894_9ANNE|nr:DgyrCDS198 [Dimorphilus gyrociliatus]
MYAFVAICKTGCLHGFCDRPGECRCDPGWQGDKCDRCKPFPNCKNGYCLDKPWQCICKKNWGGSLCNEDLDYCGTHKPCQNGGLCKNTEVGQYVCECTKGFYGINCENGRCSGEDCSGTKNYCWCLNGGSCHRTNFTVKCLCQNYYGEYCQHRIDNCKVNPCLHGGRCYNWDTYDYFCRCPTEFTGKNCSIPKPLLSLTQPPCNCNENEQCFNGKCVCRNGFSGKNCSRSDNFCDSNPCLNDGTCINSLSTFQCICQSGWEGSRCEDERDNCLEKPCKNGGTCISGFNNFTCKCPTNITGALCDGRSNPSGNSKNNLSNKSCFSSPCLHGSTCLIVGNDDFICICKRGFDGSLCEKLTGHCLSSPCQNGGRCIENIQYYSCECKPGFMGKLCEQSTHL